MDGDPTIRQAFTELAPRYEQVMDRELGSLLSTT